MSVIFKTLQKLRQDSLKGGSVGAGSGKRQNVYTLSRMVSSFPGIFFLGLLIILSVFAALYGISYFGNDIGESGRQMDRSARTPDPQAGIHAGRRLDPSQGEETASLNGPIIQKQELPQDIPPPPPHIPVEEARPGKLYTPSFRESGNHDPGSVTARYIPPESRMDSNLPDHPPGPSQDFEAHDAVTNEIGTAATSVLTGPGNVSGRPKSQAKPEEDKSERIRLANVEKSARLTRLVAKIQEAIQSGESTRVEMLMNRFESIKGKENDYIIRLKAFWQLEQGDHEAAASLLSSLLKKDEDDLEAGINMAVLEIRTQKVDQARSRLKRLRHIYHDNTVIPALLKKIGK